MLRLIDDICTSQKGICVAVDRSTLIQNAQRFMARGQIDKAIEEWQKLIKLTPQDGNLYNTIGDLNLKKNDTYQAIKMFLLAAAAFERAGFALKTIAVYKKILKVDPSNLDVNLKMADLNAERGLTGNAIEDYLKVAKEYGRAGKVQKALEIYRKIANFDPSNTNIRLKLAELSLREKLTSEAIDEYMKVAQMYERSGRTTDATGIYKKILEINPTHPAALEGVKETVTPASPALPTVAEIEEAMAAEDWELAGQKTSALLLHEPTNIMLRHLHGKVLLHKGDKGAAWADYRAVVDEAIRAQRREEAIQRVQEYVELAPDQREAVEVLASLLEEGEQVPEAVQALATLIDLMDRDGVHESAVKECFLRMKVLDPAGEVTGRYLARFEPPPDQPPAQEEGPEPADAGTTDMAAHAEEDQPDSDVEPDPVETSSRSVEEASPESVAAEIDLGADVIQPASIEEEMPAEPVQTDVAASAPNGLSPLPVEQYESNRSISDAPSDHQPAETEQEQPSVEVSPLAEVSQSQSRGRSTPSVEQPAEADEEQPSVEVFPRAEASQSRSLGRSTPSVDQPAEADEERPSVEVLQRAEASQSQSRDRSANSPSKPSKTIRARDLPDYFAEADVYLKYGLAAKAIEQYQLILSIDVKNIEAHAKLRELYQLEGRMEEAVTHSISLARLYQHGGEHDIAELIWAEAKEWCPEDPRLQGNLRDQTAGAESRQRSRRDDARAEQDETVQRPKQDLQEWLAEAEFYLQQGLQEQAHELFETIRHHYPDAPEVAAYFTAQHSSAKDVAFSAAGAKGLDEMANEPASSTGDGPSSQDDGLLSKQLAELFPGAFRGVTDAPPAASNRLTASVEGVIRAVEQGGQPLPPEGPDPHYSLGLAYKEMGLYAEARKELEQAVALPSYRVDAVMMIAACYQAEGQSKAAVSQMQQCLESLTPDDPKWADVAYESARLYAEIGEADKAVSVLHSLIRADSSHEQAVALLKTLQQSAPSNRSKEKEKSRSQKRTQLAAEDHAVPKSEAAAPAKEQKPDKNKRRRISYV
jgi:tetratricopeptide (TPR) repeat protein